MQDQSVIDHIIEMKGDIASIKAMLKPLADHETRLGRVEGDVKTQKRIFGGLFSIILVTGAGVVTWLRSL